MTSAKLKPNEPTEELALEFESLTRDVRAGWRELALGNQVALVSALGMVVSAFLPWITIGSWPTLIGLNGGGALQLHAALGCLWLLGQNLALARHVDFSEHSKRAFEQGQKRHSLWLILIGLGNTLAAVALLLYYASLRSEPSYPIDIRYGFYLSLLSGLGIFCGGILRFLGLAQSL